MELRDFVVTPLVLIIIYVVAYIVRPRVTDSVTRVYFFPALTVKLLGAIAVGMIYQFYYSGGDTYMYHTYGSRVIWETFSDSPIAALKLLLFDGRPSDTAFMYKYSSQIYFFRDPPSYAIVRIAAVFDLITFSSYSATALLFAVFSFIGMWMFFLTFYEQYPQLHRWLAVASFFIPSVFFWGSGLLKDTITLGCLGIATFEIYKIFIVREPSYKRVIFLLLALYGVYAIKIYILLTFLPMVILWIFMSNFGSIRSGVLKLMIFPFVLGAAALSGYYAIVKATEGDDKYSLNNIAKTSQATAYDIRYWSGRDAGSGYSLGELDGTFGSMIELAPQAINVSLFRPYLWEVKNLFMLLTSIESTILLVLCFFILFKKNVRIFRALTDVNVLFTLSFALSFAFAVGVSTFNFGTLARYKIPMLPFFFVGLSLILNYSNNDKKFDELEETEY